MRHFLRPVGVRQGSVFYQTPALSVRKPLDTTVPQDENLPTCAPSGLEPPPTYQILGRQNNSATKAGYLSPLSIGVILYHVVCMNGL